MPEPKEFTPAERLLLAYGEPDGSPTSRPCVIIGLPEAGWRAMEDGRTHTADLTPLGIPFAILLVRGEDRAAIARDLGIAAALNDLPILDGRSLRKQ